MRIPATFLRLVALIVCGMAGTVMAADPVGLSLIFRNGSMQPIQLVGSVPRYLSEVDILVNSAASPLDLGIQPLTQSGEASTWDWSGVQMVEEDWRAPGDGTWTRQRFYRGARWMKRSSIFTLIPQNNAGIIVGIPLVAVAGSDDQWIQPVDDGFVRRFVARQIATGCPAKNNCAGAQYVAQALVQLRINQHPDRFDQAIPENATKLSLVWTEDVLHPRSVNVTHAPASQFPFGYGLQVQLAAANAPANGQFYVPGEPVTVRMTFRDGAGARLHPVGSLPTYGQFVRGEVSSGLRYFDPSLSPTLYYALKHRESNTSINLLGPTNKLKTPKGIVSLFQFFDPQIVFASVPLDGYSAVANTVPAAGIIFGGLSNPAIWDTPVPDTTTFTIPSDALPGTYVSGMKIRREFGGEALNVSGNMQIQVGTATATAFSPGTGPCTSCHTNTSAIGKVLHGQSDRRTCYGCHAALDFEPDNALDIRVHTVHDRSNRFPGSMQNCSLCHVTAPTGAARGLLP